ncbi:DNA repair protein RAD51 homolog 3 isoform X3 [Drosophila willistoni]|nr:DNA repair protein RAD51 homolog 3 isoform X3 [Drosophila willistoni]
MLSLQNICKKSSFDLHNKRCFRISTGNKSLDVHLKGGIPLGKLIELIGNPGTGKTQMCMKLCLNVQLPRTLGGLDGESLFFDTRRDFNPNRLKELADEFERRYSTAGKSKAMNAEQMLRNVHYVQCTSPAHLIAQVRMTNKYLAANPNIKIIIIDSLSFALRMIQTVRQRYELLLELYVSMRSMLYQHQDQVT